jgi:hypothetical protein
MLGMHGEIISAQPIIFYLTSKLQLEIFLGILIAMPLHPMICNFRINMVDRLAGPGQYIFDLVYNVSQLSLTIGLFYFTCISLAAGVYNPFIYFRF